MGFMVIFLLLWAFVLIGLGLAGLIALFSGLAAVFGTNPLFHYIAIGVGILILVAMFSQKD